MQEIVRGPLERAKLVTDIATPWIGTVALIGAGIFSMFQYLENEKGNRVKETLTFLDRYNKTPFLDARRNISIMWEKNAEKRDVLLKAKPFPESEFDALVIKIIGDEKLQLDMSLTIEFFESLEVCVKKNICDADTAIQFFQPEAIAFYRLYLAHIESLRTQHTPRYGIGLEKFTERK